MILTTNYNQMTYSSGSDNFYPFLEAFTGPKAVYGMNTPISVKDIITNCGLSMGMVAYASALEDTVALSKTIGLALLRANLGLWRVVVPNNTQPDYLFGLCDEFGAATTITDMCGEPVDLPDPTLAVLGALTMLDDTLNGMSDTMVCADYYMWLQVNVGEHLTEAVVQSRYGANYHLVDGAYAEDPNYLYTFPTMGWYSEQAFDTELAIDGYVNQSNRLMSERSSGQKEAYQLLRYKPTNDALLNTQKEAARLYIDACRDGAYQVIYDDESLPSMVLLLNQAYNNYGAYSRVAKEPLFGIIGDMAQGRMLVVSSYLPEDQQALQAQMVNAYYTEFRRLLRDKPYLQTFDNDTSGGLNLVERQALETAARAAAAVVAADLGNALALSLTGEFTTLPIDKQIENVILEYVD